MEKHLDLRGLSCPIPLIKTRDALKEAETVTVVVDEPAAKENITKFAKSQQYVVETNTDGADYILKIRKK